MVNPAPSVFLFISRDNYPKEKAVTDLTQHILGDSSRDLDRKVFYAGESNASEIMDHINTIPFLASKRLVIIKALEKAPSELKDRLARYIKKPLRSTCLVLESSDDSLLKDYPDLAQYVSQRRFGDMDRRQMDLWIKDFLAARGKKIGDEAISILLEFHGQNLSSLMQELEKLASFTGRKSEVNIGDVEKVAGRSLVLTAFELADAVGAKRAEDALRICHGLMMAGKKEYEIVGLLCWYLKRMLKAKKMQLGGQSDYRIAASLRIGQKYRAGFFRQLSATGIARIKSGIQTLLEADLDIKRTRFNPTLVLECAIAKLSLS